MTSPLDAVDPKHWTAQLRTETHKHADQDDGFVGSEEHRTLIEATVNGLVRSTVKVVWGVDSNWAPRLREPVLTKPTGQSDEQITDTMLYVVHEVNHARYSPTLGSVPAAMRDRVRSRSHELGVRMERFRGFVEDARVARLSCKADPETAPWIELHAEVILRELERAWRELPPDPTERATILSYARLFGLESALKAPEPIRRFLDSTWGTIEEAVGSGHDRAALIAMRWFVDLVDAARPVPADDGV
jgi:hypothetical protein